MLFQRTLELSHLRLNKKVVHYIPLPQIPGASQPLSLGPIPTSESRPIRWAQMDTQCHCSSQAVTSWATNTSGVSGIQSGASSSQPLRTGRPRLPWTGSRASCTSRSPETFSTSTWPVTPCPWLCSSRYPRHCWPAGCTSGRGLGSSGSC